MDTSFKRFPGHVVHPTRGSEESPMFCRGAHVEGVCCGKGALILCSPIHRRDALCGQDPLLF